MRSRPEEDEAAAGGGLFSGLGLNRVKSVLGGGRQTDRQPDRGAEAAELVEGLFAKSAKSRVGRDAGGGAEPASASGRVKSAARTSGGRSRRADGE